MKTIKIMEVTNMDKIFRRTAQGGSIGGIIGTAIGTIMSAGAVVATGPIGLVSFALVAGAAVVSGASASAIGTLIGSGVGAATGAAETVYDHKKKTRQRTYTNPGQSKSV
jgi:hypothetical protein